MFGLVCSVCDSDPSVLMMGFVGSATGDVKILEVNQDGKFVRLFNDGKQVPTTCLHHSYSSGVFRD